MRIDELGEKKKQKSKPYVSPSSRVLTGRRIWGSYRNKGQGDDDEIYMDTDGGKSIRLYGKLHNRHDIDMTYHVGDEAKIKNQTGKIIMVTPKTINFELPDGTKKQSHLYDFILDNTDFQNQSTQKQYTIVVDIPGNVNIDNFLRGSKLISSSGKEINFSIK